MTQEETKRDLTFRKLGWQKLLIFDVIFLRSSVISFIHLSFKFLIDWSCPGMTGQRHMAIFLSLSPVLLPEHSKPPHLIHYLSNMSSLNSFCSTYLIHGYIFNAPSNLVCFLKTENKGKDEFLFLFFLGSRPCLRCLCFLSHETCLAWIWKCVFLTV